MDNRLIDELLRKEEGVCLDYKARQYDFHNLQGKVALINDVLSMANGSRSDTAYILLGVSHRPGRRAEIVGLNEHADDATLQQMIGEKLNKRLSFSYREQLVDGNWLGIIEIPIQPRPFFLTSDFGRLKANTVYARHGSCNGVTDPDEIYRMGLEDGRPSRPLIGLELSDDDSDQRGLEVAAKCLYLDKLSNDEIDAFLGRRRLEGRVGGPDEPFYWYALREHLFTTKAYRRFRVTAFNESDTAAYDVRAHVLLPTDSLVGWCQRQYSSPEWFQNGYHGPALSDIGAPDIQTACDRGSHYAHVSWSKIQPGSNARARGELACGAETSTSVTIPVSIAGDNFLPIRTQFKIAIDVERRRMTIDDLLRLHWSCEGRQNV